MVKIWDNMFSNFDELIGEIIKVVDTKKYNPENEELVKEVFERMHKVLKPVWEEVYRVLVPGGIACINIGDATRKLNGIFRLFPNHAKIIEIFEEIGFITLHFFF